jgi:hypothetical protein
MSKTIKGHRRAARSHARQRLSERHGIELDIQGIERLNVEQAQLDRAHTIWLRDLEGHRDLRLVRVGNRWQKAVWDHVLASLVTFL